MAWDQSRTARALRVVEKRLTQASEESVLVGTAKSLSARVEALVRHSYGYRWLTAEPDPEIIVIDLRETRTVGPFVWLLERTIEPAERAWSNSGLAPVIATAESAFSGSRTGQLLIALLEPPEPPENEQQKSKKRE